MHCVCLNRAKQRIRDLMSVDFPMAVQQLHYTNPPSSLSTLKTEIKKERLKLGLCASLLVPSSIDGWVSCNEVVPKQGPLQLNNIT